MSSLEPAVAWYATAARDLPWRRPDAGGWAVLVSEVMLQQTPVNRVLPAYESWLRRWPTPGHLAAEEPGEAVRMWGRLGYPRRALRLHACASLVVERHGGTVPESYDALRELPGLGDYTAAAVAAFAFGRRHAVLDTNVRRVHARVLDGRAFPTATPRAAEHRRAESLLPADGVQAARASVAVMELGALVCSSRAPRCERCPLAAGCAWHAAGKPANAPGPRPQAYAGTDRQCRGRLLRVVRESDGPVPSTALDPSWDDVAQRERALAGLLADGLLVPAGDGWYRLP